MIEGSGGVVGALALVVTSVAAQAATKASVTVTNQSDWQIDHFYLSPADDQAWGEDQLGDAVISSGDRFRSRMAYKMRRCTGFKPSRTSGIARPMITLIA